MIVKAVFPGTFDPMTLGHINLIERACLMFDHVVIAVADNVAKKPLFSMDERVNLVRKSISHLENVSVSGFKHLLVDFCHECQAKVVVRGLRAVSDFEYEFQLATMNKQLANDLDTVFLVPDHAYAFLSSSLVKEVAKLNGDVSQFVNSDVKSALQIKFTKSHDNI